MQNVGRNGVPWLMPGSTQSRTTLALDGDSLGLEQRNMQDVAWGSEGLGVAGLGKGVGFEYPHAPEAAAVGVVALLREHALGEVGDQVHVIAGVAAADVVAVVAARPCSTTGFGSGSGPMDILTTGMTHVLCSPEGWRCKLTLCLVSAVSGRCRDPEHLDLSCFVLLQEPSPHTTKLASAGVGSRDEVQGWIPNSARCIEFDTITLGGRGTPMRPKETSPAWPL